MEYCRTTKENTVYTDINWFITRKTQIIEDLIKRNPVFSFPNFMNHITISLKLKTNKQTNKKVLKLYQWVTIERLKE